MEDLIHRRPSRRREHEQPRWATLETRLARLEADNRRLRRGAVAVAALLVAASLTAMRSAPAVPEVLSAKSFELVDNSGRLRATWRVRDDGVVAMAVLDESGEQLTALELSGEGPPLAALDLPAQRDVSASPKPELGDPAAGASRAAEQDGQDSFDWAE